MEKTLWQGEKLFVEGRIEEAEQIFLTLLDQDPVNPQILNNLGVIHCTNKAFDQAETCFIKALEADGYHVQALQNLSKVYEALEKWDKALVYLENCIKITGIDPELQARLSRLNGKINKENGTPDWLAAVLNQKPERAKGDQAVPVEDHRNDTAPQKPLPKGPAVSTRGSRRPFVSVGLPVYNGEEFIRESIESILSQDFKDFKFIISDNGSTDATPRICAEYEKLDHRVSYHRIEENIGAIRNFSRVLDLADTPFFMWAADDDLHHPEFLSKCLSRITEDPSIALVYPTTEMMDKDHKPQGLARDTYLVDQEEPVERFRQLIWNLGLCNMFYGLFRTKFLRTARSTRKHLYRAYDNLLLAETALSGKIVQIDEPLFTRRMTRGRDLMTLEELNANLINAHDSYKMAEGITLPHCRLTYAHFELINESKLSDITKNYLFNEIRECFKSRFGSQMLYEIDRALKQIDKGVYYYTWDKKAADHPQTDDLRTLNNFHINNLIKVLQEAAFIYPELPQIREAQASCLKAIRADTGPEATPQELAVN
jgi:glycosyltransferase involved in cell wall biosynthesis